MTSSIITFFFQPLTRLVLCRRKPPNTTQHICFRLGILHFKPLHLGNDLLPLNISVCYKGRSRFIICHTVADLFWHYLLQYLLYRVGWGGGRDGSADTHTQIFSSRFILLLLLKFNLSSMCSFISEPFHFCAIYLKILPSWVWWHTFRGRQKNAEFEASLGTGSRPEGAI